MNKEIVMEELRDWNLNADFYDVDADSPFRLLVKREMLEAFSLHPCENMLDVGCGTGDFSVYLQKFGRQIVALDFSPRMLRKARLSPSLNYVRATANSLPLRTGCFDIVISNGLFHHLKSQGMLCSSLAEFQRVLRNEGFLCLLDRSGNMVPNILLYLNELLSSILKRIKGTFSECGTTNEAPFGERDLDFIIGKGFSVQRRKFLVAAPFQLLMSIPNGLYYVFGFKHGRRFQSMLLTIATQMETKLNAKWLCMEQCVKLRKLR